MQHRLRMITVESELLSEGIVKRILVQVTAKNLRHSILHSLIAVIKFSQQHTLPAYSILASSALGHIEICTTED